MLRVISHSSFDPSATGGYSSKPRSFLYEAAASNSQPAAQTFTNGLMSWMALLRVAFRVWWSPDDARGHEGELSQTMTKRSVLEAAREPWDF